MISETQETFMKTVQQIADFVGGTVYGEAEIEIQSVGSLERAQAGDLAYAEGKHLEKVVSSSASCVLVPANDYSDRTVIVVDQPRVSFANIVQWLLPQPRPFDGIHPTALVGKNVSLGSEVGIGAWTIVEDGAEIGDRTLIYPGCYIGRDCQIGTDCVVYPRVVVYPCVQLGDRIVLHAGSVLGADGFGFAFDGDGYVKVPQVGRVSIGSDVEIGANTCVDRGALDETIIGEGAKIDNLCQIGHNVQIGNKAIVSSQTGVAGSSRIGDQATIGGQVGIADYCRIDDHAIVGAQCGVPSHKRVPAGEVYWGTPARPLRKIKQQQAHISRLPKLADEVARLQAEIDELRILVKS